MSEFLFGDSSKDGPAVFGVRLGPQEAAFAGSGNIRQDFPGPGIFFYVGLQHPGLSTDLIKTSSSKNRISSSLKIADRSSASFFMPGFSVG